MSEGDVMTKKQTKVIFNDTEYLLIKYESGNITRDVKTLRLKCLITGEEISAPINKVIMTGEKV